MEKIKSSEVGVIDHITPEKTKSDVSLKEESSVPEKMPEGNAQTQTNIRKGGILRRISQTPDRIQRSRTEISISKISQKIPELVRKDQPQITSKPSKIKAPSIFPHMKKEPSIATDKSSNQQKLASRKKSKSSLELQFKKNLNEAIKPNEASKTSRLATPSSVVKLWSLSSAGIPVVPLPAKVIHKPGTIPSYLGQNKCNSLQIQVNKRQKAFNEEKKAYMQLQAKLVEKHEDLVKYQEKLKDSGAKDVVVEKLDLLPVVGAKTGNGDAVEQTSTIHPVLQSEAMELANYNILRFVEAEMKNISDSYLKLCQDFLDTNFEKDMDSEALEDSRCVLNSSMLKLTENIAQMQLEQETALLNCQTELKSMLTTNVKGGTSKSVQDLIAKTEQQNARQIQQLSEQIEVLRTKVLAAEQQNKILVKTKTDIENNREKLLKTNLLKKDTEIGKYIDKCNRLDILNKGYERKISEMEAKMVEPVAEIERLSKDLEAATKQLSDHTQQYSKLKVQVTEMRRQHQHSIAENEEKLSKEREEKDKVQADLIQAKELIEQFRNQPVELNSTGGGEQSCGDVSDNIAASIEMESHQCIINQMKQEIQHLVHERQRLLDIPDITQNDQKFKTLEANLAKYDRKLHHKNAVIYKLEHQLHEETKRLYDSGASMQLEIVNLKRLDEEKQSEIDSLRTQLSQASAELRKKDETIGMNKRLLRIRNELIELRRKDCPESVPCKWHDQQNIDNSARSEEFSNLFSTLTHKQIAVSQQYLIIKRLEEHQARGALARAKQMERFKELEAENTRLRLQLSAYNRPSTSSVETLQNSIDLTTDLDRNEMYINDRKHKRKSKVNINIIK